MQQPRIIALIMAAGSGSRMNQTIPKPYLKLNSGKTVLRHTLERFTSHPEIDAVRVIYDPEYHELYQKTADGLQLLPPVQGGSERYQSVYLGLTSIAQLQPEYVLIHDAARPLVTEALISRTIEAIKQNQAVVPALPVTDTLRKGSKHGTKMGVTVKRDKTYYIQTPQAFNYQTILNAHAQFQNEDITDDAALMEKAGIDVAMISGSWLNFKITTSDDIERTNRLLIESTKKETRIGQGFDVHALIEPEKNEEHAVWLCNVKIPHDKRLKGHSYADVATHALVDAILGAIAEGDIGEHFPPSEPKWKGANSADFLQHAMSLLHAKDARLINIDVTIICEAPKLSDYKQAMRERLAELCELDVSRISVKATTTEKLGFTGRGEGIAAQAMVSVEV